MSEIDHTPPGQADAVRKEQECELTEAALHLVSGGGINVANDEKLMGITLGAVRALGGPARSELMVLENVVEVFVRGN